MENEQKKTKRWKKRIPIILAIILWIASMIQVNFAFIEKSIGIVMEKMAQSYYDWAIDQDVPQKKILEEVPLDKERGEMLDKMQKYNSEDTWAIYMYVCGSDLESGGQKNLSELTSYQVNQEAQDEALKRNQETDQRLAEFVSELEKQGMELPYSMYETQKVTEEEIYANDTLPGAASADIDEILEVSLPKNIKIILQTGGSGEWVNTKMNPNRQQRFLYDCNGLTELEDQPIQNMANPETLTEFLTFCRDEHPADHTMIIFWNHGAGAFGYGVDDLYGGDVLSLKEMRQAMEQVYPTDENNPPFELIGFDACLMGSVEVAENFHGYGKYLVGSEELEPGDGWDYSSWLNQLAQHPEMNGAQLGKAITDSYVEYYAKRSVQLKNLDINFKSTLSVVDLNKAHELYDAYGNLAKKALQDTVQYPSIPTELGRAANRSVRYAETAYKDYNTVDLGVFMENIHDLYPQESQKILQLLQETILYTRATSYIRDSQGLSIYYPVDVDTLGGLTNALKYIQSICDNPDIKALYYYKIAGCLNEEYQEYLNTQGYGEIQKINTDCLKKLKFAEIEVDKNGNFNLELGKETASFIQDTTVCIGRLNKEQNSITYFGEDAFAYITEEGKLCTDFEGKWMSLDGHLLSLEVIDSTDSIIRYRSAVHYDGHDAYLLLGYDLDKDEMKILGVQILDDGFEKSEECSDTIGRNIEPIKVGKKIQPLYNSKEKESGVIEQEKGKTFQYRSNSKLEDRTLEDGDYIQYVRVRDGKGNKYQTPMVSFKVQGGQIIDVNVVNNMDELSVSVQF